MQNITSSTPSDELVVSQNGNVQKQPQSTSSTINRLLEGNTPFVVWLIFFAIGGGILALYHARIGYLPDIEWKAALIYLFVGSIVGGVIGLLLIISLYVPGVIWSETIIYDPSLEFSYPAPGTGESGKEPVIELCIWSIVTFLGLPFLFVLLISHVALLLGEVWYWVVAVGLLVLTYLRMRILFGRVSGMADDTEGKRQIIKLSSWFTLSVFLNQISMYLIYQLSGSPTDTSKFVVLTVLCTAGVWLAAHVVAVRHRYNARQAVAAALVVAGLLLFSADKFSSLSTKLMNHYGIGEDQQVTLLLTDNGKRIVEALGLPNSPACSLPKMCNVEIFSKVGNEYFLSVSGKTFTLPKSDVISIQADDRTRSDER